MEEQIPKPNSDIVENPIPEQTPGPVVLAPTPVKRSKKRWVWYAIASLLVVVAGLASFLLFKHHQTTPKAGVSKAKRALSSVSKPHATDVSLVHLLYTSTTPPHAQNSNDGPVLTAVGHYLELNGNGVLVFDGKVVAQNPASDGTGPVPPHKASIPGATVGSNAGMKISDAVLSKNGLHYGFLLTPVNGTNTSDVYIDGKEVGPLSSAGLLAVSNDGKSYLDDRELSKVTPTTYNTGIHEEALELNGSQTIVTSDYGFLGEDYSGDLQRVLAQSRNYTGGSTYYLNTQKLNNCSYEPTANTSSVSGVYGSDSTTPEIRTALSQDGVHVLCIVFRLGSPAPADSGLNYQISSLQVFEDDKSVLDITKPIVADNVQDISYASTGQWMFFAGSNVITLSGMSPISALFSGLSSSDANAINGGGDLAYVNPSKYILYLPATHKLLTKGLTLTKSPDLTSAVVSGIEYSSMNNALYVYDSK